MLNTAQRIRILRRPEAQLRADDFGFETIALPSLRAGDVLLRTRTISLDPYLARRIHAADGPEPEWKAGLIVGRMIAEVVSSMDERFKAGQLVLQTAPWQDASISPGAELQKLEPAAFPASMWLGTLGSSGITAWAGMRRVIAPREGETIVVSAAAGPVGSVAGQLARMAGARVVGIAGGPEKCAYVRDELGFDECIDHRHPDFSVALAASTPAGVDALFENVGAATLDPVLARMNKGARIALCGLFQHYQDGEPVSLRHFRHLLDRAIRLQGFHVSEFASEFQLAKQELSDCHEKGMLRYRETTSTGFEKVPHSFIDMLAGRGLGKHIVTLP